MRDLGSVDPWQESLERSLARRGKHPREAPAAPAAARAPAPGTPARRVQARRVAADRRATRRGGAQRRPDRRRRGLAARPKLLAAGSWGILLVTVIMVAVGGLVDDHGAQASADSAHAHSSHPRFTPLPLRTHSVPPRSGAPAVRGPRTCRAVTASSGYVNPVAGDVLVGERIDQGVDYAGTGRLRALGAARITYIGTNETGWPGAFVEYRLLAGPDAGCFVYYAEGITPAAGLRPGQRIAAGQMLARIIPGWATGIELGWGAGRSTETYAAKSGRWSATDDANSVASGPGKSFSALVAALGGPAGRVER